MEINRGFKFVKLKIKCRYIHYKRQGFAALSFNNCLTRREQEIPLFYKDATEKVVVKSYI